MEETKSIKHRRKRAVRAAQGDQAVTRVNVEQASKRAMRTPSPLILGEGWHPEGKTLVHGKRTQRAKQAQREFAGLVTTARTQRKFIGTRETRPHGEETNQRKPREGMKR
jgi:hypothetical protein